MSDPIPPRLRPPARTPGPRCRNCGVVLFPEEQDFCAAHERSRIDNTGTVETWRDRSEDGEEP